MMLPFDSHEQIRDNVRDGATELADKVPADAWPLAIAALILFVVAIIVRKIVKAMVILLVLAVVAAIYAAYRFGLIGG